ncbi:MAG: insulinase family protein, partial [Candidatus Omnitrophica bacterium]|nr:insulinase family protein [Candidatus Omnitrophota bacterium]
MRHNFKTILSILMLIITSIFPTNLSAGNNLKKFSLENGLTCILENKGPTGLIAISLRVASGSAREEKMLGYGISHLAEHMAFKSCKGYPLGMVEKTIRQIGARMNATTSYDTTNFFMTIPKENLQTALDLLTNMIFFPSYDSQELQSEKDVVCKEIILRRDRPSTKLHDLLYKTAYLEHPYRHPIIGYDGLLKSITKEEIESYHQKFYQPANMVLAIVGDIDFAQTEQLIRLNFSPIKNTDYFKIPPPQEPEQLSPRSSTDYSDINLSETSIAFLSTELLNSDLYRLDLLAAILGRGDASLLNTVLVKEKQLVQSISCYNYTPKDRGLFVINFISQPEKIDQAVSTILGEIDKLKINPISKKDLNRAKKMIASDLIYQQESLSAIASSLTSSETMTGDYNFDDSYIKEIKKVTAKEISSAAKKYLNRQKATTAHLLPNSCQGKDLEKPQPLISSKPEIQTLTLRNKIRSISIRHDLTPTAAITIIVNAGLNAESKENSGISNILSEMLLKGTTRHKEGEIKSQFESRGADIASFGGPDSLGITVRFLKDDLKFTLEMLYELFELSVFPDQEFERIKALT